MKLIKLFEAFKKEDYTRAFNHIKSLLNSDSPKEDIIKYIDNFTGDVAKELDNIRLIIDRTAREFNMYYTSYLFYNRKTKKSLKRKAGSDYIGSWNAGDIVSRDTFDTVRYYTFPEKDDRSSTYYTNPKKDQSTARSFVEGQKHLYNISIEKLSHLDIRRMKFFCDRFFEIMDWVVETGPTKYEIIRTDGLSEEQKKYQIEELNDFDMDNEYEEVDKIAKRVGVEVKNLINTL